MTSSTRTAQASTGHQMAWSGSRFESLSAHCFLPHKGRRERAGGRKADKGPGERAEGQEGKRADGDGARQSDRRGDRLGAGGWERAGG